MKKIIGKYKVWNGNKFSLLEKQINFGSRTIIKVISCGFCGTDKHSLEHLDIPGMSFGHEILGEVIFLGKNHKVVGGHPILVGDRVLLLPGKNCGECFHCLSHTGQENLCSYRTAHGWGFFDKRNFFPAGGFSSYIEVMDEAWLVPVPHDIPNDVAVLAEPLAIAVRAVDRSLSGTRPDRDLGAAIAMRAAVVGIGSIGYLVAYVLRAMGADVVGFDTSPWKCEFFRKNLGFEAFELPIGQSSQIDKLIVEKSPIKDFDTVFECGGTTSAFVASLLAARKGGRVIELGNYVQDDYAEIDPSWICRKELDVIGHVLANPYTYEKVFRLMNQAGIEALEPMVTKKIALSNLNEILSVNNNNEMKVAVLNDL